MNKLTTPIHGHYFSIITIVCGVVPFLFAITQIALSVARRIRKMARQALQKSAEQILKDDTRAPILFLRDFEDDQGSLKMAALPTYLRLFDPEMDQPNLEAVLQNCLSIGPAVAVGRPEDLLFHRPLLPLGVSRKYVKGEGWQQEVLSLMDAASLIVVNVSESEGVSWEIEQLRQRGHIEKSVFIVRGSFSESFPLRKVHGTQKEKRIDWSRRA